VTVPSDRPRVCFFVGPSAPPAEFREACRAIDAEAAILPPVEQGDLLRLLSDPPDVIGIVDGYFFERPAVLHKEILLALEAGARVLGAASLGALRAAELDRYGMEGVGRVYRMYARGEIDGDDEVAVLHAEAEDGYRPLTVALVDLRHNLRRARARGVVSPRTVAAVVAAAKRRCFVDRSAEAILDAARRDGAPGEELAALRRFLRAEAVDLKREDALALVRAVAEAVRGGRPGPRPSPPATARTTFLRRYLREYVGRAVDGRHVPDALVLALHKLLSPTAAALHGRIARRCLAIDEARWRGIVGQRADLLMARFRVQRRLWHAEALGAWLGARCLAEEELAAYLHERDLEERCLALYRTLHPEVRGRAALHRRIAAAVAARTGIPRPALARPLLLAPRLPWDGPLLRELKVRGEFGAALERAGRIVRANAEYEARNPRFPLARLRRSRLERWCAARWGVAEAALPEALLDRGFADADELDDAARRAYTYERFGSGEVISLPGQGSPEAAGPGPVSEYRTGPGVCTVALASGGA
jgi:hypothetical protein